MKKVNAILLLVSIFFTAAPLKALTPSLDGILTEWTGPDVVFLGSQPSIGTGQYTLLATWDTVNLYLAVDRKTTGRYLGDTANTNDSFFVAIDTDNLPNSGGTQDGYGILYFSGSMRPDFIYCYAGGSGWYETCNWTGSGWNWRGWTNAGTYYGWAPSNPDDELIIPLSSIGGSPNVRIWAWMTREGIYDTVDASWPAGVTGYRPTFGDGIIIRPGALRVAYNPNPSHNAQEVPVSGLVLSWNIPTDPNGMADPNLVGFKVYIDIDPDPNMVYQGTVTSWDSQTLRASFPFNSAQKDTTYWWRVDTVLDTGEIFAGNVWVFSTELSSPKITGQPAYQVVPAGGTAVFTVTAFSPSPETYQWYKAVEGGPDIALTEGGKYSGTQTAVLSIANAQLSDEGRYYCIVNNESNIPVASEEALLGIRRRIAYWPFEDGNPNSIVPGSPVSILYGDPAFTTGIVGDAMEFDADADAQDLLYTNPEEVSYFDICNHSLTVACWIKASSAATWGPMVARNGEFGEGWQLRHSGFTLDRVCLTTRGTGNDEGTPTNRTVYDGQWHYVVGTFDGAVKKVYIDGVLSRVHSADDGSIIQEFDAVSGRINPTGSPVSLAGRVRGDTVGGLIIEGFSVTAGILDEVEIYNYALDAAEIAQKYADITRTSVCPAPLQHDLNGDCRIDLDDLALLASKWLLDTSIAPQS
ncbi:MAG TPA: immunoglobulin domain-containing protein [Anaerohalosphaeraceae bacterium]|nr:immunoglobulin domain-containing protein [Anaerohalosphaeraceae bacterium]